MTDGTEPAVRASDGEREAVVSRLNEAVGEGRLSMEEFSERVAAAYAARTRPELAPLTADLPPVTEPQRQAVVPAHAAAVAPSGASGPSGPRRVEHMTPIGSVKRSGAWRLERDTEVGVVIGTVKLDLRRAFLAAPEVTLEVSVVIGTIKVTVPEGVRVEVTGASVVGTRKIDESQDVYAANAPVLRLKLETVLGTVKVYRR